MPLGKTSPPGLSIYNPLIGFIFISTGAGLRKYKIWARLVAIISSVIAVVVILFTLVCRQTADLTLLTTILIYSAMITLLLMYIFNIYYLTRPTNKELFTKTK